MVCHETMRIYQALPVSDHKEAAKKALVLGIIRLRHAQTLNAGFTLAYPID